MTHLNARNPLVLVPNQRVHVPPFCLQLARLCAAQCSVVCKSARLCGGSPVLNGGVKETAFMLSIINPLSDESRIFREIGQYYSGCSPACIPFSSAAIELSAREMFKPHIGIIWLCLSISPHGRGIPRQTWKKTDREVNTVSKTM